jgi:hypothetical protein
VPSFLVKLYEIVDGESTNEVVGWSEEGDSFVIKNSHEFSEVILPKYFKHNNFSSFIRQLNMYDFHKSRKKSDIQQVFKHPFFLKDKKHLLPQIKRKSNSLHPLKVLRQQVMEEGVDPEFRNMKLTSRRL